MIWCYFFINKSKNTPIITSEEKNMKVELTLVLKTTERAFDTLKALKSAGFNATVMSSESLRHALDYYPGEHTFINLRHIEQKEEMESVLCLFLVDDNRLEDLKNVIREYTNNFKEIKGFMYSRPIDDYEGSI